MRSDGGGMDGNSHPNDAAAPRRTASHIVSYALRLNGILLIFGAVFVFNLVTSRYSRDDELIGAAIAISIVLLNFFALISARYKPLLDNEKKDLPIFIRLPWLWMKAKEAELKKRAEGE